MKPLESFALSELGEAERIALAYAPRELKPGHAGLLLLDAQLRRIALSIREPALAQIRIAWWRDACVDLAAPKGHPALRLLAQHWRGREGALAGLIDGWEELAVHDGDFAGAAENVAHGRAAAFAASAALDLAGACMASSRRWTLVSLADHAPDPAQRAAMLDTAGGIERSSLPRSLRPLAVLDGLARRALQRGGGVLLGDRLSPLAAIRLGIFGR